MFYVLSLRGAALLRVTTFIRKPFVLVSLALFATAFGVEAGSRIWIHTQTTGSLSRPGLGIPSLAALDLLVVFTMVLTALTALGVSPAIVGRIQGVAAVIISLLGCLGSLVLLFITIALLMLMIGLLLAVPFGTMVYLAAWGDFPSGSAGATLAVVVLLKLAGVFFLVLASEQVLKSKMLVVLFICSIGLTVLVSFLQGFPPGILASITDAIGAIIVFIVAIIWAIIYLIGGIISVFRTIRKIGTVIPQ